MMHWSLTGELSSNESFAEDIGDEDGQPIVLDSPPAHGVGFVADPCVTEICYIKSLLLFIWYFEAPWKMVFTIQKLKSLLPNIEILDPESPELFIVLHVCGVNRVFSDKLSGICIPESRNIQNR